VPIYRLFRRSIFRLTLPTSYPLWKMGKIRKKSCSG